MIDPVMTIKKLTLINKHKRTLSLLFYYDNDISNGYILFTIALASKYQIKSNLFFLKVGSRSGSTPPGSATLEIRTVHKRKYATKKSTFANI